MVWSPPKQQKIYVNATNGVVAPQLERQPESIGLQSHEVQLRGGVVESSIAIQHLEQNQIVSDASAGQHFFVDGPEGDSTLVTNIGTDDTHLAVVFFEDPVITVNQTVTATHSTGVDQTSVSSAAVAQSNTSAAQVDIAPVFIDDPVSTPFYFIDPVGDIELQTNDAVLPSAGTQTTPTGTVGTVQADPGIDPFGDIELQTVPDLNPYFDPWFELEFL